MLTWQNWAQHKKPKTQIEILKTIATEGFQSETSLIEILKHKEFQEILKGTDPEERKEKLQKFYRKHNPTINVALSELSIKSQKTKNKIKMLESIGLAQPNRPLSRFDNVGYTTRNQECYDVNNNAIKWLLNNENISEQEFIDMVKNYFKRNVSDKMSLLDLIGHYEKRGIVLKNEYITPKLFEDFLSNKDYFVQNYYNRFIQRNEIRKKIYEEIAFGNSVTLDKITKSLNVKELHEQIIQTTLVFNSNKRPKQGLINIEYVSKIINEIIEELLEKRLIKEVKLKTKTNFELTHFGFIELLYNELNGLEFSKLTTTMFDKRMEKLLKKHSWLLPEILKNNNYKNLGIKPHQICLLLIWQYRKIDFDYGDEDLSNINNNTLEFIKRLENITDDSNLEYQTTQMLKKIRQNFHQSKLSKFSNLLQNNVDERNNELLLISISEFSKLKTYIQKDQNNSIFSEFDKLVENRICMDFLFLFYLCCKEETKKFLEQNSELLSDFIEYQESLKYISLGVQ